MIGPSGGNAMKIKATIRIVPPKSPNCAAVVAALDAIARKASGFDDVPEAWDEHVGRKLRAGAPVELSLEAEQFARFILLRRQAQRGTDVLKAGDSYKRLTWEPIGEGVEL
jgi:hypothetical protein